VPYPYILWVRTLLSITWRVSIGKRQTCPKTAPWGGADLVHRRRLKAGTKSSRNCDRYMCTFWGPSASFLHSASLPKFAGNKIQNGSNGIISQNGEGNFISYPWLLTKVSRAIIIALCVGNLKFYHLHDVCGAVTSHMDLLRAIVDWSMIRQELNQPRRLITRRSPNRGRRKWDSRIQANLLARGFEESIGKDRTDRFY